MKESEKENVLCDVDNGIKTAPNGVLETSDQRRRRMISLNIIYFTMFLMTLGFSIILTGVWPFLETLDPHAGKEFLGLIVAANPLGQMLFSPLFGYWMNKVSSIRYPFICSITLFCISSALYSSLELIDSNVKYWMLASRFIVGAASADVVVCRSYVSAATTNAERTKAISMLTLAQTLGFIFGPLIQGIFTPLDNGFMLWDMLPVNMYTAPGWSNVVLGILNIFLFLYVFEDHKIAARENMLNQGLKTEKEAWKSIKPDHVASWALIFSLFAFVFNFVLLESLGTPLTMENFAWSNKEALRNMAYIMGVGGIVSTAMFFAISPLCKRFKESNVLIYGGFVLMVLGRIAHIPYGDTPLKVAISREFHYENGTMGLLDENDPRVVGCPTSQSWCHDTPALGFFEFFVGFLLTCIGYPVGLTLIQSIFSKVVGPRPQGLWQSLITGSGCASRIIGPLFVSLIYARYGTLWLSVSTGLMMVAPVVWLFFIQKRLDVQNIELNNAKEMVNLKSSEVA